jgi:phage-related protein
MASDPTRPQPGLPDWLLPVLYPRLPPRIFFVNNDPDRLNLIELINRANATIDLDEAVAILLPALGGSRAELREKLKATGKWVDREDLDDSSPGDAVNDVTDIIQSGIDNAGQVVDELEQIVGDYVQDAIGEIVGTINDATGGIVGEVIEGINRGRDIITNVLDGIEGIINDGRGILDDIFSIVSGRVDLEITNVINIPSDIFEVIVGGIGDILEDERRRMGSVLGTVVDGITGIFSDVIEEQARTTITIATSIGEQTQVQEESADELLDEVKEINNETIDGTGAAMAKGVGLVMDEAVDRSDSNLPQH